MTKRKQPTPAPEPPSEPVFPLPRPPLTEHELEQLYELVRLSKSVRLEQRSRWHNGILAFDRLVRKLRKDARSDSGTEK